MNVSHPYKLDKIDYNNIIYTDIKSVDKKKIIYLKYKEKNNYNKLVFQTPYLFFICIQVFAPRALQTGGNPYLPEKNSGS